MEKQNPSDEQGPNIKQSPSNEEGSKMEQKPSDKQAPEIEKQGRKEAKKHPLKNRLKGTNTLSLALSATTTICMFLPWITVPRIALFISGTYYAKSFSPILLLDAVFQYKSFTPHWDYRNTGALVLLFAILWIVALVFLAHSIYKTYKGKTSKSTLVSAVLIAFLFLLDLKIAYNYGFLAVSSPVTLGPGSYLSLICVLGAAGASIASKKRAK
ncbi:MAG: hypothetical protein ACI4B9_06300 [Eggerthellaceae bacterium]